MRSPWVDDAATRRIMEQFYTAYLDKERSPLDALRDAKLWALRNPGKVRGVDAPSENAIESAIGQRLSPKYWAAFSLAGDWR